MKKNYTHVFFGILFLGLTNTTLFGIEGFGEESYQEETNPASVLPAGCSLVSVPGTPVRYGDYIRIKHGDTGLFLHSHAISYFHPKSSGQQQVTCFARRVSKASEDACWWQVLGAQGSNDVELSGKDIDLSQPIRLRAQSISDPNKDKNYIHNTMMLHSHNYAQWSHPSPVREPEFEAQQGEKKQEVSCCADNNDEDNWIVLPRDNGLNLESTFTLKHSNSQKLLRSKKEIRFNVNQAINERDMQLEVCCVKEKEHPLTTWRVALIARKQEAAN